MKTADTPTPAWIWMIVLSPFLVLLCLPAIIYVKGRAHAQAVSDSLVPIDATVLSVREFSCGGRQRHVCYRIVMEGMMDGHRHLYQTNGVPGGRDAYGGGAHGNLADIQGQRIRGILVTPRAEASGIARMYWERSEPVAEFKANSFMMLCFIGFELLVFPFGYLEIRKRR
jgi:hypothetical protein